MPSSSSSRHVFPIPGTQGHMIIDVALYPDVPFPVFAPASTLQAPAETDYEINVETSAPTQSQSPIMPEIRHIQRTTARQTGKTQTEVELLTLELNHALERLKASETMVKLYGNDLRLAERRVADAENELRISKNIRRALVRQSEDAHQTLKTLREANEANAANANQATLIAADINAGIAYARGEASGLAKAKADLDHKLDAAEAQAFREGRRRGYKSVLRLLDRTDSPSQIKAEVTKYIADLDQRDADNRSEDISSGDVPF